MLSPAERSERARLGGLALRRQGKYNPRKGLEAAEARYLTKVDELYPGIPEKERQIRAALLRKEHYARMTFLSLRARSAKKAARAAQREPIEGADRGLSVGE